MIILFWISLFVVIYTYVGYGILLFGIVSLKRILSDNKKLAKTEVSPSLPELTIVIAAYNEEKYIEKKLANTLKLDYPSDLLYVMVVSDGSTDLTPQLVEKYPDVQHFFLPERKGKIAAVDRVMPHVTTPVVVFTDANTEVNQEALVNMARHFNDPEVGAVAGEKRILVKAEDEASSAGEGFYWKYESALKKWDSELRTVVGAAGELFAVRTELYPEIPLDTIIEDFYTTLTIAKEGYRVVYEPEAYAMERGSASVKEELKRKVRIAAGGIQSIVRLAPLLNVFRYGWTSFQYISHRVLRWTITPFALITLFIASGILAWQGERFYIVAFAAQILFYIFALVGERLASRSIKRKIFFIPYYFCMMNYAVIAGILRYLRGNQSVVWERAERAQV
uniref:Glycosyltransferase family 2 protein n=1 Tax=Roseihalotalea indica TaxID=2867963 RepID=A0AA49JC43_9BACT|nr:glycosyltransferase family 2 protein [Tunicatimonas sp. TK19036]